MTTIIDKLTGDIKESATKAVKALAEKHGGTITPEIILADAKRKRSPLHSFFCWDDTTAAHKYREIQASAMIRRIKVTYHPSENKSVRVRAFVNVIEHNDHGDDDTKNGISIRSRGIYVGFEDAIKFENYKDQIIAQCKRDIESFKSKYASITEASKIINAMDQFTESLSMD